MDSTSTGISMSSLGRWREVLGGLRAARVVGSIPEVGRNGEEVVGAVLRKEVVGRLVQNVADVGLVWRNCNKMVGVGAEMVRVW